jgi:hypothetical protein
MRQTATEAAKSTLKRRTASDRLHDRGERQSGVPRSPDAKTTSEANGIETSTGRSASAKTVSSWRSDQYATLIEARPAYLANDPALMRPVSTSMTTRRPSHVFAAIWLPCASAAT